VFKVVMLIILIISCGKIDKADNVIERDKDQKRHQEDVLNDFLRTSVGRTRSGEDQVNKKIILLDKPFWSFINKEMSFLSAGNFYFSSKSNNEWEYLNDRFLETIGSSYFDFRKSSDVNLSISDLFFQKINVKNVGGSAKEDFIRLEGRMKFFDGRLNFNDSLSRDRFLLNIYRRHHFTNQILIRKKIIEGENYFFTNPTGVDGENLFFDSEFISHIPIEKEVETISLEAAEFFHQGLSKSEIINQIYKKFNLLFFFSGNEIKVYLLSKSAKIKSVLKEIDPNIDFNEYDQVLMSSKVIRNEFINEFPTEMMATNNLNSTGIFFDEKLYSDQKYDYPITVYRYYEGDLKKILMNQYKSKKIKEKFVGPLVEFDLNRGELFRLKTIEETIDHEFVDEVKEVKVILKKPQMVCERYEVKMNKFCLDSRKVFKVKARFRRFLKTKKIGSRVYYADINSKNLSSLETNNVEIYRVGEVIRTGEKYNLVTRLDDFGGEFLDSVRVKLSFDQQNCRNIKTGFIGLVEPNNKIKLVDEIKTENHQYCFGNKYNHQLEKMDFR